MAKKRRKKSSKKLYKLFSLKSLMVTIKAMAVGIIVGIPATIFRLIAMKWMYVGIGLGALYMIIALFGWGFLANKLWGWK